MSEHRVLCVDDEPQILEALALQLRNECTVYSAGDGAEGLRILAEDGPFTVVVSDMRMPGMDGAAFLAEARVVAPEATRMLLTGHADLNSAITAVNAGGIFRFLTKPCPSDQLRGAVRAGIEQHQLVVAERVLLQETVLGSIKTLGEVLALTAPAVYGRAARVRDLAMAMAEYLELEERWMLDAAATLAPLGIVSLPEEVARKHARGEPLKSDEATMVARVPQVTLALLARIPRLEPVCRLLATAATPDASDDQPESRLTMLSAGLLRLADDFDALEAGGTALEASLATVRGQLSNYPSEAVDALLVVRGSRRDVHEIRDVAVQELCEGMVLLDGVQTTAGQLLLSRGHVVTAALLARLRNLPPDRIAQPIRVTVGGAKRIQLTPGR